ncbi:hypothetical protein ACSMFR_02310 [Listeria aquatica]|uniref:hypothetical protein n=1 Tax=Listeria aquatica TaxID=1494960 RepID=UPI003F72DAAD
MHIEMQNKSGFDEACQEHQEVHFDLVRDALFFDARNVEEGAAYDFPFGYHSDDRGVFRFTLLEKNKQFSRWRFDGYVVDNL